MSKYIRRYAEAYRSRHPERHRYNVKTSQHRVVARARLAINDGKCQGCSLPGTHFHHIHGDGSKEQDRSTPGVARTILRDATRRAGEIALLCRRCHEKADSVLKLLRLPGGSGSYFRFSKEEAMRILRLYKPRVYGKTMSSLAKKFGCSRETIRHIVDGDYKPLTL